MRKLTGEAALKQICLKTQISFVRNLDGIPFPTQQMRATSVPIAQWLEKIALIHPFDDLTEDPTFERLAEARFGLAPQEDRTAPYRLLRFKVTEQGQVYTIWCELMAGNHFTFSLTGPELNFTERAALLEAFADRFAAVFNFAYDEEFGYLTSLPTLTGTGLRIRSWLHLSGLATLDYLPQLTRASEVKGVLCEFMPGEEPPPGDIFILYNRFSMNLPVERIVKDYQRFLQRVAQQEMKARMRLAHDRVAQFYDELNRTLLLCRHSILIPEREALNLLSSYWTGVQSGALQPVDATAYDFNDCFDAVRDTICPITLLNAKEPYQLSDLPPICRQEYLLNYDILRALWFRKLAESTFTPEFLHRLNRL